MNWSKTIEYPFRNGGFSIHPYQLALGGSLKYLPCLKSVMFRFYLGPFKLWFNLCIFLQAQTKGGEKKKLPGFRDIIGLFVDDAHGQTKEGE